MNMPMLARDQLISTLSDRDIVRRVRGGESALFEILMRRHNQRLYRVARAVMKNESEVEDVMQQAYIKAFTHLDQFEERAQFSTWLTQIALREAFSRRRKLRRIEAAVRQPWAAEQNRVDAMETFASPQAGPEHQAYARELSGLLEAAVDSLPEMYRTVFMLREIEGLTTSETAESLELGAEAVKTRLHRARAMIRRAITERVGTVLPGAFQFHAPRCDRVVAAVFTQLSIDGG
jgi:RNA polymerase sigma-70 factor (ECF subfamily)